LVWRAIRDLAVEQCQILAQPVQLADVPLDGRLLVGGQRLGASQRRPARPNRSACGQGGTRCACKIEWVSFLIRVRWRTT
jgi:hypothetical protein